MPCLCLACSARGSPHTYGKHSCDKEYHDAVYYGRPWIGEIRWNTRSCDRDYRAATPCSCGLLAHTCARAHEAPGSYAACAVRAFVQRAPDVRDAGRSVSTATPDPLSTGPLWRLRPAHTPVSQGAPYTFCGVPGGHASRIATPLPIR